MVPSPSHKREVTGLIPAGCTTTFLSPLLLSPHRLTSYFDVWRHLSSPKIRIAQSSIAATRQQLDPPMRRTTVQPQQSTGEEHKEATKQYSLGETIISCSRNIQYNKTTQYLYHAIPVTTNENLPDK
jgi:hypothetical protein